MKHLSAIILPALAVLFLCACRETVDSQEAQAGAMLGEARILLAGKSYDAARDTILALRKRHPHAIGVRRAAILTLDSVELMQTRDTVALLDEQLEAERKALAALSPTTDGKANQAYYDQRRRVYQMEQHFDELCAKVKFYIRKIDIDTQE